MIHHIKFEEITQKSRTFYLIDLSLIICKNNNSNMF